MNCHKCNKLIVRSSKDKATNKIQCSECRENFHGQCVGFGETELSVYETSGRNDCAHDRRLSRSYSDGGDALSQDSNNEIASLKILIKDLGEKLDSGLKRIETDLGKSLESCHEKLDENAALLSAQQLIIEKQNQIIESLKSDKLALSKKITELSVRLTDLEQYSRSNTLEIHGIPGSQNENVAGIVMEIGKALDVPIKEDMIVACHRLKQKNNRPSPGIIVKFVHRTVKERIMERRRVKRTLSTRHLGLASDTPIYINQSLCQERAILFAKAKKVKKELNFKFLWIDRTGNIKIRRDETSTICVIKTDSDIEKLAGNRV
ncbi:uncharacterized protein LOC120352171 [Nilaparvata lugens]|uniref:uncharacterized protein LOC120352171 n=1 Tax=Nilaparvata lugens TaxID=108931 RepID=UPI00193E4A6C|nr:uncharacterized protein LOC120352171 [Nilaparvata lugens]